MHSETPGNSVTFTQKGAETTAAYSPALDSDNLEFDPFSQPFKLGAWQVDPLLNQLKQTDGNVTRHLEPRLAKLLCYLAAHELQVVERDTLVAVLWPRVIVNENSLTRAVSELRKLLVLESDPDRVYIETIPKRGYRLRIPPKAVDSDSGSDAAVGTHWQVPMALSRFRESAVGALCLALTLGVWLQYETAGGFQNQGAPTFADELVYSVAQEQLRDEVVLSTSEADQLETNSSTEPVLARDEQRFAFIQYDHTGSTIFLGEVDGDYEPVPIFNSRDVLFNLAWSPLEDSLLFAGKPSMTTTALFDREMADQAKLYSFDLESFRLSLLVEEAPGTRPASDAELSLT